MNEPPKHSIGDEIPYRRDQIDKRTGSLVFDRHLEEKVTEAPVDRNTRQGNKG